MSEILKKNLDNISKFNKPLCEKILAVESFSKNFEISTNLKGEYNLLIDGKPVHSITDIQKESQSLLKTISINENTSIHFIYGVGLGYHIDEYIQNGKGKVVVFEPDIETLFFVLSSVDFSDNFKNDRLYFISDYQELDNILNLVYRYKTNVTISFLDYYKLYHKLELQDFKKYLQKKVDITDHNYNFQVKNIYNFFLSTLNDVSRKYQNPLLTDYKDIYKNKPALIVSAGPSLHKNIETIKKYQNNALIFCVGTALRTLCSNGITPDFVNVIERNNTRVHYDVKEASDIIFIAEPFTQSSYLDLNFKQFLTTSSLETDDARWFLEMANKELVDFETKGTVAYHAIYSAYYFGCNPIILIGQDLAYSDGQCYCKGSKFDGLQCVFDDNEQKYKVIIKDFDEFKKIYCQPVKDKYSDEKQNEVVNKRLEELNKNLCTVQGQDGNMLPTDSVYSLFIEYIKDFAVRYKNERILINSSLGGANIDGFELLPLEKAVVKYANEPFNKANIIDSSAFKTAFDYELILENLTKERDLLESLLPEIDKGFSFAQNFKKELARAKIYSDKASSFVPKLVKIYTHLTNDIMLKHRIFKMVSLKEYSEINYLMRLGKDIVSYNDAKVFLDAFYAYFSAVSVKMKNVISILDSEITKLEEIYESRFAKS